MNNWLLGKVFHLICCVWQGQNMKCHSVHGKVHLCSARKGHFYKPSFIVMVHYNMWNFSKANFSFQHFSCSECWQKKHLIDGSYTQYFAIKFLAAVTSKPSPPIFGNLKSPFTAKQASPPLSQATKYKLRWMHLPHKRARLANSVQRQQKLLMVVSPVSCIILWAWTECNCNEMCASNYKNLFDSLISD